MLDVAVRLCTLFRPCHCVQASRRLAVRKLLTLVHWLQRSATVLSCSTRLGAVCTARCTRVRPAAAAAVRFHWCLCSCCVGCASLVDAAVLGVLGVEPGVLPSQQSSCCRCLLQADPCCQGGSAWTLFQNIASRLAEIRGKAVSSLPSQHSVPLMGTLLDPLVLVCQSQALACWQAEMQSYCTERCAAMHLAGYTSQLHTFSH